MLGIASFPLSLLPELKAVVHFTPVRFRLNPLPILWCLCVQALQLLGCFWFLVIGDDSIEDEILFQLILLFVAGVCSLWIEFSMVSTNDDIFFFFLISGTTPLMRTKDVCIKGVITKDP